MNTKICKARKVICECGGSYTLSNKSKHEQTRKHRIKERIPQSSGNFKGFDECRIWRDPYDIMHCKASIIDNTYTEMFGHEFATYPIGELMEFYDHVDYCFRNRKKELNNIRSKECLRQLLCDDIVGRVFEYKFN